MTNQEMHELLVSARNVMAKRGLTKGVMEDARGRVCLRGALNVAHHGHASFGIKYEIQESVHGVANIAMYDTEFIYEIEEIMGFEGPMLYRAAVDWNNNPLRTLEEVLARFDEAIAKTAPEPHVELEEPVEERLVLLS